MKSLLYLLVWHLSWTDPLYASFHDEEWGVPVHEDSKLFELLVFSQALAELNWPEILNKRNIFRYFSVLPLFTCAFCKERSKSVLIFLISHFDFHCRKLCDNFDPSSIAQFTEKKLSSLKVNGILLLSEPKLRAVVENAKLILKATQFT